MSGIDATLGPDGWIVPEGGSAMLTSDQLAAVPVTPAVVAGPATPALRAANSDAIDEAFDKVVAAGGGVVLFPSGTFPLARALRAATGVKYKGQGWSLIYTQFPDSGSATLDESFGTVLIGDGTFDGLAHATTGITAAAALALYGAKNTTTGSTNFSNAGITGFGFTGIGLKGFRIGMHAGAQYVPSFWYPELDFAVTDCTQWGVWLENYMHQSGDSIVAMNNSIGQCHLTTSSPGYLAPGNGDFQSVLCSVPQGVNNLPIRGLVISAYNDGALGSCHLTRVQTNRFSQISRTESAGMTNASTSISVADLTSYEVGMPVVFSATANGFRSDRTYFVLSRSGTTGAGTITVGNWMPSLGTTYQPSGYLNEGAAVNQPPALAATGNAAISIISQGFPCVEVVGFDNADIYAMSMNAGDFEGGGTARVFFQRVQSAFAVMPGVAGETSVSTFDVVGRNITGMFYTPNGGVRFDVDTASFWQQFGNRTSAKGSLPTGLSSIVSSTPGTGRPSYGIGLKAQAPDTDLPTITYDYWQTQNIELNSSGLQLMRVNDPLYNTGAPINTNMSFACFSHNDGTATMPTITASMLGLDFVVANLCDIASIVTRDGVATLTAATGQRFNNISTTLMIPAKGVVRLQARYANHNNTGQFYWAVVGTSFPFCARTIAGAVGPVTQYTASGRVGIAAAGSSVVVTNPFCLATSMVKVTVATNDATALLKNVVPAAGSFTIRTNAAVTADTYFDYEIVQ